MKNFILMLRFFTRLPSFGDYEFEEKSYGKSTFLFPFVGLILGIILFFIYKLLAVMHLSIELITIVLLISNIYLTGGLHLDGLADSFDGLFSYRTKERILEIMKDPHIGVNGVISLICVLGIKFVLYKNLGIIPIVLSLVSSRLNVIYSASFGSYARANGMASAIIKYNDKKSFFKSLILVMLIFIPFKSYILVLALNLLIAVILHKIVTKIIKGITGDTLGFVLELSEISFLLIAYILEVNLWL